MKLSLTQMPELKEAILSLPEKEKDKLLIRLINKDQMLIKQLHYKLLENEDDLIARTNEVKHHITESFTVLQKQVSRSSSVKKHDLVNVHIRQLSGVINEHAAITKDKVSEFELRLLVLDLCFTKFPDLYDLSYPNKSADKHFEYVANRIQAILTIYDKLHPDLQYDYKNQLLQVLEFVTSTCLEQFAKTKNSNLTSYFD